MKYKLKSTVKGVCSGIKENLVSNNFSLLMIVLPPHLRALINKALVSESITTPCILFSDKTLVHNLHCFVRQMHLPEYCIFFPVKTNNNNSVLKSLDSLKTGFEIASAGELRLLSGLNINPDRIMFSNPVKIISHIAEAYAYGIKRFAFDNKGELEKIACHAPQSEVYIRIDISNEGAEWELSGKFGASGQDVAKLFLYAEKLGLFPTGVSFHVGWNNTDIETWADTVKYSYNIIKSCKNAGVNIKFLNIGGGFPAHGVDQYSELQVIASVIRPKLSEISQAFGLEVYAEPGSFLTANAGALLTSIYDIVRRNEVEWVFVDSGISQGFYWILGGLKYKIFYPYPFNEKANYIKSVITGPTCDSHDVFAKDIFLPDTVRPGDLLAVFPAGAYVSSAKDYNGFSYPEVVMDFH